MTKVESIEQLKREFEKKDIVSGFISFGIMRSSKDMWLRGTTIVVNNLVDDSICNIEDTNVIDAIAKGAFYLDD